MPTGYHKQDQVLLLMLIMVKLAWLDASVVLGLIYSLLCICIVCVQMPPLDRAIVWVFDWVGLSLGF